MGVKKKKSQSGVKLGQFVQKGTKGSERVKKTTLLAKTKIQSSRVPLGM